MRLNASTYVTAATAITADGYSTVTLPPGTYKFAVATATAVYVDSSRLRQAPDATLPETQPHRAAATRRSQSHEAGGGVLSQVRRRSRGAQTQAWFADGAGRRLGRFAGRIFSEADFPGCPEWSSKPMGTLDLVVQALFGTGYRIKIEAGPEFCAPAKRDARGVAFCAGHALEAQKIFSELGRRGAEALNSLPREQRSAIAKKAAATRREKRLARKADLATRPPSAEGAARDQSLKTRRPEECSPLIADDQVQSAIKTGL